MGSDSFEFWFITEFREVLPGRWGRERSPHLANTFWNNLPHAELV